MKCKKLKGLQNRRINFLIMDPIPTASEKMQLLQLSLHCYIKVVYKFTKNIVLRLSSIKMGWIKFLKIRKTGIHNRAKDIIHLMTYLDYNFISKSRYEYV